MRIESALCLFLVAIPSLTAAPKTGAEAYKIRCAGCHELSSARIPSREALGRLSQKQIVRSLQFGVMSSFGRAIPMDERQNIAAHLSTKLTEPAPPASAFCKAQSVQPTRGGEWNGWSPKADQTRYQSPEAAGLSISQLSRLKLKWSFGFAGDITAFGAPTVINGRVYVGSAAGVVYALGAQTGCILWTFEANGPVRSGILAVKSGNSEVLLFGDQNGWFYALESKSGKLRWRKQIESHEAARLTGSPVEKNGVVFVPVSSWEEGLAINPQYECCTFRGSLVALRVSDGSQVWKTYMVPPATERGLSRVGTKRYGPSGAGIWGSPTIDSRRSLLYVATGDNYSSPTTGGSDAIVALDVKTGKIRWTRQTTANDAYTSACGTKGPNCPEENGPDFDFGASVMLVRNILVAGQKSGMVYALDPDADGKILWAERVGKGGTLGGVQWGMSSDGQQVYATVADFARRPRTRTGPEDLRLSDLDPEAGGGITALRVEDGRKNWHVPGKACAEAKPGCSPAQSAALTSIAGAVFSGSFDGHLRAFASETGTVIWDFNTAQEFKTVNGVPAKGGSMDGAGPVIASGMLFVNSGYARFGGMPGNVLLAFALEPELTQGK